MVLKARIVDERPKEVSADRGETKTRPQPWHTPTRRGQGEEVDGAEGAEGVISESAASWKPWVRMKGKC